MACGVARADLMVRVGSGRYEEALKQPHVREMDFTGRPYSKSGSVSSLHGLHVAEKVRHQGFNIHKAVLQLLLAQVRGVAFAAFVRKYAINLIAVCAIRTRATAKFI